MAGDYVRLCPTCGAENAPDVMRCTCGAMLFGVDLVSRAALAAAMAPAAPAVPTQPVANTEVICRYPDCGQSNPPGSRTCLYCNRPLGGVAAAKPAPEAPAHTLITLPPALRERYRVVRPFPTAGAEADLLLVEPIDGGVALVAKIYRQGVQPKSGVQERIARIDPRYRLQLVESGSSDGTAYEVMEFCAFGSLRERLKQGAADAAFLRALVSELAPALAAVHAVGVVHRDLKPENILLRQQQPLRLVLIDYGIASVLDATQRFTGVARTLTYASPESLSGVIDGKADYWALGMIVLEAALGRHPFAGLSDAVILHHLTTRSVDLTGVSDTNLRKLLSGLLLRDPDLRWGQDEVARWLAGDKSLAAAVDRAPDPGFTEPYHLADESCSTREQLGLALSRHWKEGLADLGNGQLLAWFRDVQKDQNTVRILLELLHDSQMHVDLRLLGLILHLAPRVAPVWRGESVGLAAILEHVDLALKGNEAAARWLNMLHQFHVLDAYAAAGNQECDGIVRNWNAALDSFGDNWKRCMTLLQDRMSRIGKSDVPLFDELVYGGSGEHARPSPLLLHPRLLALTYDPAWGAQYRKGLAAEFASLVIRCPWLAEFGDPRTMEAAALLVFDALLPDARKAAENEVEQATRKRAAESDQLQSAKLEATNLIFQVKASGEERVITAEVCDGMRLDIQRYFELLAWLEGSGHAEPSAQELRRTMKRQEPALNHMLTLLDVLAERRTRHAGWLSAEVATVAFVVLLVAPMLLGAWAAYLLIPTAIAAAMWLLLPNHFTLQNIRRLARRL